MESKQCTPSVIARLMGLDELPPKQPVSKPHPVLSENYLRKIASIGLLGKRSYNESHFFEVNYEERKEFINGVEVLVVPKMDRHCIQSIKGGKASSGTAEVKKSLVRQKFTVAKHLSMDEKLWYSKDFDGLKERDSVKDLPLRYYQQPDSFFTNHLFDLQFGQLQSQSGHVAVLKSSKSPYSREREISRKSERTTVGRNILRSPQKLENGSDMDSWGDLGIDYSHHLSKSRLKLKDKTCLSPSRIVVLKQNIGKTQNAAMTSFSPISEEGSQPCDRKHVEFFKSRNAELDNQDVERKSLADDKEPSRRGFRLSREFAKVVHGTGSSLTELSRSELRVNELSTNESEVMMPSYLSSFDWKKRCQTTYPPVSRSSFTKQAKKQLSQRLAKSQEVGVAGRGTALGEMLAMPDQETGPPNLSYKFDISGSGVNNQLSLNDGDADLGSPFSISSRDDSKEERAKSSTRLESLPAACNTIKIRESRIRNRAVSIDWHLKSEDSVIQGKNESMKQNCSQKDSSESSGSRCSNEKAQTLSCMDSLNNHTVHCVQETCVILDELENKFEKEGLSEERYVNHNLCSRSVPCSDLIYDHMGQVTVVIRDELKNSCWKDDHSGNYENNLIFPNSSISTVASLSLDSEVVAVAETENVEMSSGTPEEQQSEPMACILSAKDKNSSHILDASVGQESSIRSHEETLISSSCPVIDPAFPIYLSESYSPTPNSVLEPPFNEEILSDAECFQSVAADLHGLRMQLRLLKSETEETNSEGPGMVVSSDEDSGDGSVDYSEESRKFVGLFRAEESRDFSYVVDVLDEAGFQGGNKHLGFETWYSPDSPVNPSVFEMLEKKYGEQTYWEKSERRLLFDCVNLRLKEILLPCIDVLTWAKPSRKMFSVSQSREVVEDELWMFLVTQGKAARNDLSEKALGTESRWCELQEDINPIVCEIERFLLDELAAELVSIESC